MTDTDKPQPQPQPQPQTEPAAPAAPTLVEKLGWPGLLLAAVLIGFFLYLTWTMFFYRLGYKDIYWSRAMQLYSGIEAFALAAAGALLGTQIQARNVASAERRAEKKDKEATQAKDDAAKSKSELGGYRQTIKAARLQLDRMETATERGGGTGGARGQDLDVLRGILTSVEA